MSDAIHYEVVINRHGQYSIWGSQRGAAPLGWVRIGERGTRDACLAAIEARMASPGDHALVYYEARVADPAAELARIGGALALPEALAERRDVFARGILIAESIIADFAFAHGWEAHTQAPLYDDAEVSPDQSALWARLLERAGLPADTPLPTDGLAAGVVRGRLLAVTPEAYRAIRPEYAAQTGAWERLIAHELAHVLHARLRRRRRHGAAVVLRGLRGGGLWPAVRRRARGDLDPSGPGAARGTEARGLRPLGGRSPRSDGQGGYPVAGRERRPRGPGRLAAVQRRVVRSANPAERHRRARPARASLCLRAEDPRLRAIGPRRHAI